MLEDSLFIIFSVAASAISIYLAYHIYKKEHKSNDQSYNVQVESLAIQK